MPRPVRKRALETRFRATYLIAPCICGLSLPSTSSANDAISVTSNQT